MRHTSFKTILYLSCAGTMLASAPSGIAMAQGDVTAAPDVITVTTQRRAESILDVSASLSALGEADLEARGVERLDDIASAFPSVYINTGSGIRTTVVTVRGISSDTNNPGVEQAVGMFVDGVYQARPTTVNTNLYDLERLEVVRGPQSALYGKNTIAGAMNFITKGPGEEPSFEAAVSAGDFNALSLYAAGDVVFSPSARARVSVSSQTRDGYLENRFTGTDLNNRDELAGRLTFVAEPTDAFTFTLRGDFAENESNAGASEILANGVLAGGPLADADPFDREIAQDFDPVQEREVWGLSGQADWDFSGGVLTSITAFRHFDWFNSNDNDFTALNQLRSGISEDHDQFSQEIRYVSDTNGRFDYIVGAFYSREDFATVSNAVIGPDLGIYPSEVPLDIFGDIQTTSYAVFGQGDYVFTDALSVTFGLRYSEDEKEVTHSASGDPFAIFSPNLPETTRSRSDAEFTPSLALNWEPDSSTLLYASYARGYKSGGYNVFSISPTNDAEYDPEFVDSYEIGAKRSFAGGSLYLAGAIFYLEYTDLQVNSLILVGGTPTFTTSNAATAETTGFEIEGRWVATDSLSFSGGYSYNDASYDSFPNATPSGDDFSGNALTQSPDHSFSLAADFETPVTDTIDLVLHGDLSYRSEIFFAPNNDPDLTQGDLTLVNARAGFSFNDDRWSVMAWGRNLTDEDYAVSRNNGVIIPGQQTQALGAPRTWGVELRGRF